MWSATEVDIATLFLVKWMANEFAARKVTRVFVLGDVLDTRQTVSVNALSAAANFFRTLTDVRSAKRDRKKNKKGKKDKEKASCVIMNQRQ